MILLPPICEACTHRHEEIGYRCDAFPDGIPDAITVDGFDHRQPFDGDHGIRFELADGQDAALALYEATK